MANELKNQIERVNNLLQAGEPENVTVDEHSSYASSGYKPQAIFDALNEVFEIGTWGFEEISNEVSSGDKGMAVAKVKVWLKGADFQPTGWGQAKIIGGNIGDGRKGANTDAIKKAFSYFSIGNRAYLGLLSDGKSAKQTNGNAQQQHRQPQPQPRPQPAKPQQPAPVRLVTAQQMNALYDKGKERGLWQSASAMYAYFAAKGTIISKETALQLTATEYQQLDGLVEQEQQAS